MHLLRFFAVSACCAALALPLSSFAQSDAAPKANAAPAPQPISPAESLNAILGQVSGEIIGAAEAMPADKYDFAPSGPGDFKGVRTFAQQVRHVAQANYQFFHHWNIPGYVDPKSLDSLKTKDELVKALRDSFAFDQAAINSITPENAFNSQPGPPEYKLTRASMAVFEMEHTMDHYGQMVEYLRMNGIIPPASRK
ncbi:MAG TPA: DinB family protein [Silvibacterium sp.]|nr:DinB family protein [Silvibacterium sp.]